MQRKVTFYKTTDGKCPVADFIDSQPKKIAVKIVWILKAVQELKQVPKNYFKKITDTDFYEVRIESGGNIYRLLGFFYSGNIIILTNGFQKKTQRTPKSEIEICKEPMNDFFNGSMKMNKETFDLDDYIAQRKEKDGDFGKEFESGYEEFKIGMLIKEMRLENGMTQEQLSEKLSTKKSVISRMENHSEDIRLSTLKRVATVFGKQLKVSIL
ncbi:MAG: type II toxin-antitoxin system RelE/ParE family toxin [Treponema sp.]